MAQTPKNGPLSHSSNPHLTCRFSHDLVCLIQPDFCTRYSFGKSDQTRLMDAIASYNGYRWKMANVSLLLSYPNSRDAIASKSHEQIMVKKLLVKHFFK